MDKELKEQIDRAIIPKMLKDYFLRNYHIHLYISESLLNEIEESYIEYDSLYELDDAEFCAFVIAGTRKQDKHDYFYHYLKKVLDSNLILTSKSIKSNHQQLMRLEKGISNLPEDRILVSFKDLLTALHDFKASKDASKLFRSYILDSRKKHFFITRNVIIQGFRHIITRYILFCITREECYCIGIYGLPRYTFRECRLYVIAARYRAYWVTHVHLSL